MSGAYEIEKTPPSEDPEAASEEMQMGITFACALVIYLILTFGSGDELLFWSTSEVIAGIILSLVAGYFGKKFLFMGTTNTRMTDPNRWVSFLMYLGPFLVAMAKANVDVAMRVITGEIKPGIVRISPNLKTDLGITMLANSITLTPGTLTVDIDEKTNDLFIHWIYVDEDALDGGYCQIEPVCGTFPSWARKVAE